MRKALLNKGTNLQIRNKKNRNYQKIRLMILNQVLMAMICHCQMRENTTMGNGLMKSINGSWRGYLLMERIGIAFKDS